MVARRAAVVLWPFSSRRTSSMAERASPSRPEESRARLARSVS
mgnify:CR=1 FL=1